MSFEKSLNLDYNEYQLKNFINSRTSGEGFKDAVKGGLQKIWKFIKGIIDMIIKGFNNFWTKLKSIFTRKKKEPPKESIDGEYYYNEYMKSKEKAEKLEEELKKKENILKEVKSAHKNNSINLQIEREQAEKLRVSLDKELNRRYALSKKLSILKDGLKDAEYRVKKKDGLLKERNEEIDGLEDKIAKMEFKSREKEKEYIERFGELKIERLIDDFISSGNHICAIMIKGKLEQGLANLNEIRPNIPGGKTLDSFGGTNLNEVLASLKTRMERLDVNKITEALNTGFDPKNIKQNMMIEDKINVNAVSEVLKNMAEGTSHMRQMKVKVDSLEKLLKEGNFSDLDETLGDLRMKLVSGFSDKIKSLQLLLKGYQTKFLKFMVAAEPYIPEKHKMKLAHFTSK